MAAADDHAPVGNGPPGADPSPPPASTEDDAAFLAAVEAGIADTDAGRTIPGEAIFAWIESLATVAPLPLPRCE